MGLTRLCLAAVLATAALVLTGCGDLDDPGDSGDLGASAAAKAQPGTGGAGASGGAGGRGSGSQGGKRQGRFTLTSGPTLDGDFSAPKGQVAGAGCAIVRSTAPGSTRVVRVRFVQDEPQVISFGGPAGCPDRPQVADPCEGATLDPDAGTECEFLLYGHGDVNTTGRLVVTLEQKCVDRSTPACELLPASADPSSAEPITVTWQDSKPYYYCASTPVGAVVSDSPCPQPSPEVQSPTPDAGPEVAPTDAVAT
ncbi:hypothetical protein N5079_29675 [Planotetraspora sp. A-T 1434]|uniref:hypothetical protein n=1 Tax=Planotetraspora sp. A-T 1434 TaxID=2979219 RepID=UPI0021C14B92|nr:hypothetical protein [Planotetraspora sp. A-T 1434]MCT9934382.1 hypothetical protein [Planotetraspora sp. A-T 1434]